MEPVALRINAGQTIDPLGSAIKGMQLGQMGLEADRLRQELVQQQQQLRTAAIAEQEAQRALNMRQYEDTARRSLADIMKRHTKPDASGRNSTDLRAALAEARMAGIDPSYTADLEGKLFSNEAGTLRNEGEKVNYIKKTLDEMAPQIRYMDEKQAVNFLQQRAPLLARATTMPSEEIAKVVAQHFNLGTPGASIVKTAQMFSDAQIAQEREREQAGRGVGRDDFNPESIASKQAREFLIARGLKPAPNANLVELRKDPRFETAVKEYETQALGQVPSAGMRREDVTKAAELSASRRTYNDALAFETELRQTFGTRAGSFTQEALNNWISQDPRRALLQAAQDAYKKETGSELDIGKIGVAAAFARLRGHEAKLRQEQETFAKLGATSNIGAEAQAKIPAGAIQPGEKVSPETQKARDTDAAGIQRSEYDKAVEKLKADPGNQSLSSDVDALARELKRAKITVPGSSDVLRGAKTEAAKPADVVRLRNKATGQTFSMPKDVATKALQTGKFERI